MSTVPSKDTETAAVTIPEVGARRPAAAAAAAPGGQASSLAQLLEKAAGYRLYAIKKCNAYYKVAEAASGSHIRLGIPVLVANSIVGSAIFASLSEYQADWRLVVAIGLLSITGAVLSALQTFLKFSEKAEKNRTAAAGYEALRRQIDIFGIRYAHASDALWETALKEFEGLVARFDELSFNSPSLPNSVWDSATARSDPAEKSFW